MSPEGVFLDPAPPPGVIPFENRGELRNRESVVFALVTGSAWKVNQQRGDGGEVFNYTGVVRAASDVGLAAIFENNQNLVLQLNNVGTFRVVGYTDHAALKYVEVELRQVQGDG